MPIIFLSALESISERVAGLDLGADDYLPKPIVDRGIMLAGGGALVRGISDLISHETGIFTHIAEDPLLCVVNGCGQVLEDYKRLQRVLDTPEFVRSASSL